MSSLKCLDYRQGHSSWLKLNLSTTFCLTKLTYTSLFQFPLISLRVKKTFTFSYISRNHSKNCDDCFHFTLHTENTDV